MCRFNKHVKNLVRNASQPEAHLANSATQYAGAKFFNFARALRFDFNVAREHNCVLSVPTKCLPLSTEVLGDLRLLDCDVDSLAVSTFAVAHIMGIHFRANEWLTGNRCGSVVTCVVDGQSLYARVIQFLKVDNDVCPGYAIVEWFSVPQYPYHAWLVPVCTLDGHEIDDTNGSVIRITDIQPSQITVGRNTTNDLFFMMRDSGYDVTRTTTE